MTVKEALARSEHDRAFFFEKFVRIRPKKGGRIIPLVMRPAQLRLMEIIDQRRALGVRPQVVILKSRQLGFSTVVAAEFFRRALVYRHRHTLISAHKAEPAEILFDRIRLMYEQLPASMKPKQKASTVRKLHFEAEDSRLEVAIANEARAMTAQDLHISELAFYQNAVQFMTSVMETCPDEPEATVIVESTPNGVGNYFHELWIQASRPGSRSAWVPMFVPWFDEPLHVKTPWFEMEDLFARTDDAALRAQEIVKIHKVSHAQIAWWLDHLQNTCNGELDVMEQEQASDPINCFLASGRKVFETKALVHFMGLAGIDPTAEAGPDPAAEDARDCELEPNPVDRRTPKIVRARRGHWRIFRSPVPRNLYIVGGDISAGDSGSDPSPLTILNRHTMNLDATWYGRTPPDRLAKEAMLAGYWYNVAQIAGEANNQGILFNTELERAEYPEIYYRRVTEQTIAARPTLKPGFWTSGENRHLLFGLVRRYVREHAGLVEDSRLVWEWTQLRFEEGTDRIDHPDGGYSDLTLAFAIALAAHLGSFEAALAPLALEEQSAALSIAQDIRQYAAMGLDTRAMREQLDIFGLTVEQVDELDEQMDRRARRGVEGAV